MENSNNIVEVRVATPDDVHEVMELALASVAEAGIPKFNTEKMLNEIWPSLHRDGGIICVIGKSGEKLQGVVFLKMVDLWCSDEVLLEEQFVYVRPEYRHLKGGRGKKLCEFAKKTADNIQMPLVAGVSMAVAPDGIKRLYDRLYGKQCGAYYYYGNHHVEQSAEQASAA
jgi:hypothetical protein